MNPRYRKNEHPFFYRLRTVLLDEGGVKYPSPRAGIGEFSGHSWSEAPGRSVLASRPSEGQGGTGRLRDHVSVPTLDGVMLWCMGTTQKRVFRKLISQAMPETRSVARAISSRQRAITAGLDGSIAGSGTSPTG